MPIWTGSRPKGCQVTDDIGVDLFAVETALWPRAGVPAAAVHLKGRGDFANMFVFDIPPGGSTTPQRHLYEDVVYVLEGTGSTQIEFSDGTQKELRMGPAQPVRHSAQCQAPAFQRLAGASAR